ncbi:ATP-binding protein [Verrucomicrobiota bacterium sgz303538]
MSSALALLALTYVLLRNRADATEHYVIESRLNQYVSEYKNLGLDGVRRLATLRRGRAQQAFFVRVGDAQNRTIFLRYAEDWAEFEPEALSQVPLPPIGARTWQTRPSANGSKLLVGEERLPDGGVLQVGKANEEQIDLLGNYRWSALLVLLIFVPASFAGGAFVSSRALRPVQQLTNVAQEIIETRRLDARVPSPGSGDELDSLVQVFNTMLGRIDALVRGMRDSIDNVAHDLRTPLTRLRHKAQAIIEIAEERTAMAQCSNCKMAVNALADCVEEADRVSAMLNTIVDIAETEAGLVKLEIAPLSLAELIADTVDSYVEFAEDRGVIVTANVPQDLYVSADSTALFRVFANLLDNAIKYTPAGGRVELKAERSSSFVEVQFIDTGIGVSAEDLPRIWDRLFRGNRSRSERGLGLGLSFVRAIIEAHGGIATVESQPGVGTTVRLSLPVATRAVSCAA